MLESPMELVPSIAGLLLELGAPGPVLSCLDYSLLQIATLVSSSSDRYVPAISMAGEWAVQSKILAFALVILALLAGDAQALPKRRYRNKGAGDVDDGRDGNNPCSHDFYWKVEYTNVTRLCKQKPIATVNGQYPGPALYVREGDTVIVHVTNSIDYNLTLHWHGIRQLLQNWQDGPAYVTQCPIQPGQSFTYNFTIIDQKRGTVWWHAHITWLRATLHGALIILPRKGESYPFSKPESENTLIFGEWWNGDTQAIEAQAVRTGAGYNLSDALTLNGQPGDLYNCSSQDTTVVKVQAGKTYLLRLINAAMNFELYFSIANHTLVVVEADGEYTKPYNSSVVLLTPGQSMNVLLKANQKPGKYYIATSVWSPVPITRIPFPTIPATAHLEYSSCSSNSISALPEFPAYNDTQWALNFEESIKSLASKEYPIEVPKTIDQDLFYTIGYNLLACRPDQGCGLPNGTRIALSINNNTFFLPKISIAQAYYYGINNVYTADFPDNPPYIWNFTGPNPPTNVLGENTTRVNVLNYGDNVQLVLQNDNILFFESHPFHLHGFSFYVVGVGIGTYNATEDPKNFNLVDPPLRNTVSVPAGGWTAIRWTANNPGVWLMHCHLEIHQSWGMSTIFIVRNGQGPEQSLPPPPPNLPRC